MNMCLRFLHMTVIALLAFETASVQAGPPQARIVNLRVDPDQILVLHLRPGYVSSVRVLEDVSSVVLGDPGSFKAEHSDAEPQLVFFKVTGAKPAQTNALITTKVGREISLSLVSQGKLDHSEPVDYVLNCDRPHSFLIAPTHPSFVVAETKTVTADSLPGREPTETPKREEHELRKTGPEDAHWQGKRL